MRDHDENCVHGFSTGQVLLTFLAGAAAGAVTALLTAPQSGRDTRARLRQLATDSRDRAGRLPEALAEAKDAATNAFSDAMEEQKRAATRGRHT